jgi:RNA polymerase sigma-70 factor, ECF subfamily
MTEPDAKTSAEALFRAHAPFVVRLLTRLGVPPSHVDDLVQEVFLTAHRRGGFTPGAARPTTWLAEIALRVASTARRSRRRSRVTSDENAVDAAVSEAPTPFDAASTRQALGRVERALDAMDLDRRAIFVLFELEGESCEAIAAGLGVPVGTVYSRLHAARRDFRKAYDAAGADHARLRHQGGSA